MCEYLQRALEIAKEWGLQEDVISSYKKHLEDGYSPEESANMALWDWDL